MPRVAMAELKATPQEGLGEVTGLCNWGILPQPPVRAWAVVERKVSRDMILSR